MGKTHVGGGTARPASAISTDRKRPLPGTLKVKLLRDNAKPPHRAHELDAGLDLFSAQDTFTLAPHCKGAVVTGVAVEIPPNHVGLVFVRSSIGFNLNTTLSNSVGVIDSDYRGEISVSLTNHGKKSVTINEGDKFAQLVIAPVLLPDVEVVDELSDTVRGEGGFGSTGNQ